MKKVSLLAIVMACSLGGYAQQEPTQPADKRVEYFTADGRLTPAGPNAAYRQETEVLADGIEAIRTYYPSGAPRSVIFFEDAARKIVQGVEQQWYETGVIKYRSTDMGPDRRLEEQFYRNGQLHFRQIQENGKRNGEFLVYYPSGKLKRQEEYADGKRVGGKCYDEQGRAMPYTAFEIMPVYPGGNDALLEYVRQHTQYPPEALKQKLEGEVLIRFEVDTTGRVSRVRVDRGVAPLLNQEAERVVNSLARFTPAMQDDRPAVVYMAMPIGFHLNPPPRTRKGRTKPR